MATKTDGVRAVAAKDEVLRMADLALVPRAGARKSVRKLNPNLPWVKRNISQKVCTKFVANPKSVPQGNQSCLCGYKRTEHSELALENGDVARANGDQKWSLANDIQSEPTEGFGTIQFKGAAHTSKAQVVRVSNGTSAKVLFQLLIDVWKLPRPKLLISVTGGAKSFNIDPRLKELFAKGLLKVAETPGAWIITGGTNTGVMKHVGEALQGATSACIGIATYGIISNKEQLTAEPGAVMDYEVSSPMVSTGAFLDQNHTHFILVDDGTCGNFGREIQLRSDLEKFVMDSEKDLFGEQANVVPTVLLVLEGGPGTLGTVKSAITGDHAIPVVLIKGTGRAADLLAYALLHISAANIDSLYEAVVHAELMNLVKQTFEAELKKTPEKAIEWYRQVLDCVKNKSKFTVFQMDGKRDVDEAVLQALLQVDVRGKKFDAVCQLRLTILWNRADLAREQIFAQFISWKEKDLNEAMIVALALNRVDFVKLLLDFGVSMGSVIDEGTMKFLYAYRGHADRDLMDLLYQESDLEGSDNVEPRKLLCQYAGWKLEKMAVPMAAVQKNIKTLLSDLYISGSASFIQGTIEGAAKSYDLPFRELFFWAIMNGMHEMAKYLWEFEDECVAKAIIGAALNEALADLNSEGNLPEEKTNTFLANALEFRNLALQLLDDAYDEDAFNAKQLVTCELVQFKPHTCLSLAVKSSHQEFVSHSACQQLLNQVWAGAMTANGVSAKSCLLGLLLPPSIFLLKFLTVEALEDAAVVEEEEFVDDTFRELDVADGQESGSKSPLVEEKPPTTTYQSIQKDASSPTLTQETELTWYRKLTEFYTAPVIKFYSYIVSYLVFLGLFAFVAMLEKRNTNPGIAETILILFVASLTIEEIRQLFQSDSPGLVEKFKDWASSYWNWLDAFAMALFYVALGLRLNPRTEDVGHILYALDAMLWIIRLLDVCFAHRILGPYVVMIFRMFVDMMYFLFILFVFTIAYGVAVISILKPQARGLGMFIDVIFHPYYNIYGELFLGDPTDTTTRFGTPIINSYAEPIAFVLLGIYLLMANVLLLNLLIAIFNNTFEAVQGSADMIWKFRRYELIMEYANRPFMCPPFILLMHLFMLLSWISGLCCARARSVYLNRRLKKSLSEEDREKLSEFEVNCVARFLRKKGTLAEQTPEERSRLTGERVETVNNKLNDLRLDAMVSNAELKRQLEGMEANVLEKTNAALMAAISRLHPAPPQTSTKEVQAKPLSPLPQVRLPLEFGSLLQASLVGVDGRHVLARSSPYPGTSLARAPVSDDAVDWNVVHDDYLPVEYHSGSHLDDAATVSISFNACSEAVDRRSLVGLYKTDGMNHPLNPYGRTGLTGLGCLQRWGPNHTAVAIFTRWKDMSENLVKGEYALEFLVVKYDDVHYSFPMDVLLPARGDYPEFLHGLFTTSVLEHAGMRESDALAHLRGLKGLLYSGVKVYGGYLDDPRNTDNAWLETRVVNFHDSTGTVVSPFVEGISTLQFVWVDVSVLLSWPAPHRQWALQVADLRGATNLH